MSNSYVVEIDNVGTFEISRFTFGVKQKVRLSYQRAVQGDDSQLDETTKSIFWALAYLKACIIKAPDGWNLDDLSPDEGEDQLIKIYQAIQAKEDLFRSPSAKEPEVPSTSEVIKP